MNALQTLKSKFDSFLYNYRWSDFTWLFDNHFTKLAFFIPIIGYAILFNDYVTKNITFRELLGTDDMNSLGWLNASERLKFIYYGLLLICLSHIIYKIKRPYVMKFGRNEIEYVNTAFTCYTLHEYTNIYHNIESEGHYTSYGRYYTSEWNSFRDIAKGVHGKTNPADNLDSNWLEAKQKYESLLRSFLLEDFYKNTVKNKFSLTVCIFLSLIGYVLLLIPSTDLFIKVLNSTF